MGKTVLLCVCLAFVSLKMTAQKNSVLVEGDINFSSTKEKVYSTAATSKNNSIGYNQILGYQILNHWAIGGTLSYTRAKYTDAINLSTATGLYGGPFIRYMYPLGGNAFLSGQLQATFGNTKNYFTNGSFTQESKVIGSRYDLYPILSMILVNNFGLNFSIGGIEYTVSRQAGYNRVRSFSLNFGKVINIGITKKFTLKLQEE